MDTPGAQDASQVTDLPAKRTRQLSQRALDAVNTVELVSHRQLGGTRHQPKRRKTPIGGIDSDISSDSTTAITAPTKMRKRVPSSGQTTSKSTRKRPATIRHPRPLVIASSPPPTSPPRDSSPPEVDQTIEVQFKAVVWGTSTELAGGYSDSIVVDAITMYLFDEFSARVKRFFHGTKDSDTKELHQRLFHVVVTSARLRKGLEQHHDILHDEDADRLRNMLAKHIDQGIKPIMQVKATYDLRPKPVRLPQLELLNSDLDPPILGGTGGGTQGSSPMVSQVNPRIVPGTIPSTQRRRVTATNIQLDGVDVRLAGEADKGNWRPHLLLRWQCKAMHCKHYSKMDTRACWVPTSRSPDTAQHHYPLTIAEMKAWCKDIKADKCTIEQPSDRVILALQKAKQVLNKPTMLGSRPLDGVAVGTTSTTTDQQTTMAAINAMLLMEFTSRWNEQRKVHSTPNEAHPAVVTTPQPPYQPSSPAGSAGDRVDLINQFTDEFVMKEGREFEDDVRCAMESLAAQGFRIDDFKAPKDGGRVTMEDWLEAGGIKGVFYRVQEAVPRWKQQRRLQQELDRKAPGSLSEEDEDDIEEEFNLEP